MGYEDVLNKTLISAALDPEDSSIYMLDAEKQTYEVVAKADTEKGASRIVSVRGSERLYNSPIHSIGLTDVETELYEGRRITLVETKIETDKGACLIVTCLYDGQPKDKALLSIERCKGFPPTHAVALADFMHCPKAKRHTRRKQKLQERQERT